MNEYPAQVTLYEDGVFRWSYDMDMWRNRYMLKLVLKVVSICLLIPIIIVLLIILKRTVPLLIQREAWEAIRFAAGSDLELLGFLCLFLPGLLLLTLLIYAICAFAMRGNYHLHFEMDENAIALVRSAKSKDTVSALAVIATAAALAAGEPGKALRTGAMLGGTNAVGTTYFSSVRRVKEHPESDIIELREWFGMNQIYVNRDDYSFVRDFILERVSEKARPS